MTHDAYAVWSAAFLRDRFSEVPPELAHAELKLQGNRRRLDDWFQNWRISRKTRDQGLTDTVSALARPEPNLAILPRGSWLLQFAFRLRKPVLTKDEMAFYPIDNPVRKDRALGLPIFAASSWKGCLRAACKLAGAGSDDLEPMFGSERPDGLGDDVELRAGRLHFYASVFNDADFVVLSPHDRRKRTGTPIFYECIPRGATGRFTLLYCPFDIGFHAERSVVDEALRHLNLLSDPLRYVFGLGGFGAKTSSGFGVAEDRIPSSKGGPSDGRVQLRAAGLKASIPRPEPKRAQALPRYMESEDRMKPEYLNADGSFRIRTEQELRGMKKVERQEYEKARKAYDRLRNTREAAIESGSQSEAETEVSDLVLEERFDYISAVAVAVEKLRQRVLA